MGLSKHLALIALFANEESSLTDIGTDHGYTPTVSTRQGKVTRAIATDVKRGPPKRAREHIREYHLEERTKTRFSDGAERSKAEGADAVVITGIGDELVIHILEGDRHP